MRGSDTHTAWVTEITRMCPKTSCEITRTITNTGDVYSLSESYTLLNDLW